MRHRRVDSVGNSNHPLLDNIWTLINSNNDIYDGVADYIFFRVLNLEPIEYFNLTEQQFEEEFTDEEIEELQENFFNFQTKNNFSKKIKNDIKEIIEYIRKKAIESNVIKEVLEEKYIEASLVYNAKYIKTQIIKYYFNKER